MKDRVETGHLTKYDAFRVNRDQVMDLEVLLKIYTTSNFEKASPKTIQTLKVPMKRIFFSQKYIQLGAENRKIPKKLSTKVLKRTSRVSKFPNLP